MSNYKIKVLGFGDNVVDKYENKKIMYPGGNSLNFSVYAKMLGVEKSAYMGYFGNDLEGEHVIKTLSDLKIETIKCRQFLGENGCARVNIENGERIFLGSNEGGIRKKNLYILDRFDLEYISQFDLVHSGNYSFTENELQKIKEIGIPISFDFSDDSDEEYYKVNAKNITFAFCSYDKEEEKVKEHLKKIKSYGPEIVCASRGKNGCIIYDGNNFYSQSALILDEVKDTMGAGDSLITSFIINYLSNKKNNLPKEENIKISIEKAVKFASNICMLEGSFGFGKKY